MLQLLNETMMTILSERNMEFSVYPQTQQHIQREQEIETITIASYWYDKEYELTFLLPTKCSFIHRLPEIRVS